MKEGQDKHLLHHRRRLSARRSNSPHLEIFRKQGIEVLLMYDRVDEWVVSTLTEFEGKPLQSVAKGDLDLGKLGDEAEKEEQEKEAGEYKDLLEQHAEGARARGPSAVRVTAPPDRFAGLPGERRARHEHESGAPAESGGAEGAGDQADPRDQPAPSARAAR